ncbi:MAG: hypothetical protein M3O30_14350 [Planctomycetota bacterium]|nr:hypothetical protein [Planctomycetota bacterium]
MSYIESSNRSNDLNKWRFALRLILPKIRIFSILFLPALLTVVSVKADESEKIGTRERIVNSIKFLTARHFGVTSNLRKVADDKFHALRFATTQSLAKPLVVSSVYYPSLAKDGSVPINLDWIENTPSLMEVVVRNPDTEREERIPIPPSRLNDVIQSGDMEGVLYECRAHVSLSVAGNNPAQVLEVSAPNQGFPASCYPCILPDEIKLVPTPPTTEESK